MRFSFSFLIEVSDNTRKTNQKLVRIEKNVNQSFNRVTSDNDINVFGTLTQF